MKNIRAAVRFAAFVIATLAVYSPMILSPFFRTAAGKQSLRQFCFDNWARAFIWIANAQIKVAGEPPAPPFLLVSNHLGYFDVGLLRLTAKCVFVAKADIDGWFLAGRIVRDMGTIFINRENRRDIPRAGNKIIEALERGEGVTIFAEGTTSDGKQILPFKSSFLEFAAAADLPVSYASLSYRTLPGDPPASDAVCWWGNQTSFAAHLWQFFKLKTFFATITFGARPIHNPDRKVLTRELREAIVNQFEPVN